LELIIVLALVACGYLVYLWITFANFRAELMNEFGRRGLSYSAANALFSFWSREISDMRHNKVLTAQIVDLVMQNVDIKENGNLINSDRSSGRVEHSTENLKLSVALDFLHRLKQVDDHMVGAVLGSGLIGHIQKMTIAAITMADMKVWAQRSYRVWMRRQSLSLPNMFSILWRFR